MHRFTYGAVTLVFLWACAGGDFALLWQRYLVATLIIVALIATTVFVEKRQKLFAWHSGSLMMGVGPAVIASVLTCIVLAFTKDSIATIEGISPPSLFAVLVLTLLFAAQEVLYRGILQPAWGLWSVAFLEATTLGFGTLSITLFCLFLLSGAASGYIFKRFGFMSSLLFRTLWALCFWGYLSI